MQACGHTPIWSGERVLRTNARGRHTYLDEFKHWIVVQALQPGVSLAGLAMSNQVNANQLRRWVQLHGKRLGAVAAAPRLLPVTLASASPPVPAPLREVVIEVVVGNAVVRVRDGVSPASLRMVLACLRDTTP